MNWLDWLLGLFRKRTPPVQPPAPPLPPSPPDGDSSSPLLALHNAERVRVGVAPLAHDPRLGTAAQRQADHMAAIGGYDHARLGERVREVGYVGPVKENEHAAPGMTAQQAFAGWMNSPTHRAALTDRSMRNAGFGSAVGRDGKVFWCAIYGG